MKAQVKVLKTREQLMAELEYKNFLLDHYRGVIDHLKKQNQELNALNDDLQERINNAVDEIAEKDTIIEDLKEQLNDNSGKYTEIYGDFQDTADELGATKMMLSTLRKEHDMLQKQYDGLKKTHEETKEKDARVAFEMGQSHAELYKQLHEKTTEYNHLNDQIMVYKSMLDHNTKEFVRLEGDYNNLQKKYEESLNRNRCLLDGYDGLARLYKKATENPLKKGDKEQ